ncbi:hypothetical protein CEK25_010298 [Fusarium fujikuroi]|nr:hypothetical protein CEK25_010298 [Fusarium fujikuroi]
MLHQTLGKAWSCSSHASHEIRLLLEDRVVRRKELKSLKKYDSKNQTPGDSYSWFNSGWRPLHRLSLFGFGLDDQGVLYETYQAEIKPVCCADNLISLQELLLARSDKKCIIPLTDQQRYRLSIILTSSFLQLYSTPWLNKHWNQRTILFSSTLKDDQLEVDLRHPFIAESYGSSPCQNTTSMEAKEVADDSANLLMLAKILLQIKFHDRASSISNKERASDPTTFDRVRESQLLNQWVFQERENLSLGHQNAIKFCIDSSNRTDADLWDLKFRQIVLDKVIVPLVDELNYMQGVT